MNLQHKTQVHQVHYFQKLKGVGALRRKNANWIVFASTTAKLDLLLGVCLILETFSGLLQVLPVNRARPGWLRLKAFHFEGVASAPSPLRLPCLLLSPALWAQGVTDSAYIMMWLEAGNRGRHRPPAPRAKTAPVCLASGAEKESHHMRRKRHVIHDGSLEGRFTPQRVSTTNKRTREPFFLII